MKKTGIILAMLVAGGIANASIVDINALDLRGSGVFGHADATLISGPGNTTSNQLDWVISYANLNLDGDASANDTVNFTVRFDGPANMRAWGQGVDTGFGNLNGITVSVIDVSGTTTDNGWTINFDGFTGGAIGVGGNGDLDRTAEINGTLASVTSATTGAFQFINDAVDFAPSATITYDNSGDSDFDGNGDGGFGSINARHHDLQFSAAVPEPATIGMVALFGGGILFIRRRFMM